MERTTDPVGGYVRVSDCRLNGLCPTYSSPLPHRVAHLWGRGHVYAFAAGASWAVLMLMMFGGR